MKQEHERSTVSGEDLCVYLSARRYGKENLLGLVIVLIKCHFESCPMTPKLQGFNAVKDNREKADVRPILPAAVVFSAATKVVLSNDPDF